MNVTFLFLFYFTLFLEEEEEEEEEAQSRYNLNNAIYFLRYPLGLVSCSQFYLLNAN